MRCPLHSAFIVKWDRYCLKEGVLSEDSYARSGAFSAGLAVAMYCGKCGKDGANLPVRRRAIGAGR